jgi:hypothetical protein
MNWRVHLGLWHSEFVTAVLEFEYGYVRECIQKFPDWLPGARTANGTALCHQVQLYRYVVSQSSDFCRPNPLCCLSTSVYCCKCIFRIRLSPETFGYTLLFHARPALLFNICSV